MGRVQLTYNLPVRACWGDGRVESDARVGCSKGVLEKLVQAGLAQWHSVVAYRTPLKIFERKRLHAPSLNASQDAVFQQIQKTLKTP